MTPKQALFVEEYLGNGFNAKQAAISAGYSPKSAQVISAEILSKPMIREAIQTSIRAKLKNSDMVTVKWLAEVEALAFAKPDKEGNRFFSVDMAAKTKALDLLGKFLAILHENAPEAKDDAERMTREERQALIVELTRKLA